MKVMDTGRAHIAGGRRALTELLLTCALAVAIGVAPLSAQANVAGRRTAVASATLVLRIPATPTLEVRPRSGPPRTKAQVRAADIVAGFMGCGDVRISFVDGTGKEYTLKHHPYGSFRVTVRIPLDAAAGDGYVAARGHHWEVHRGWYVCVLSAPSATAPFLVTPPLKLFTRGLSWGATLGG
jgi:hypothetical protein